MLRRPSRAAAVLVTGVAALATVSLSACGSNSLSQDSGAQPSGTVSAASADASLANSLPAKVKAAKKIVVGTDATYAPSEFLAGDGKTVQGFDVDLFKAVAQKLGVQVQFVPADFDSIITGVQAGKFDVGVSSFTVNAQREKQATMVSYFNAGTQWATAAGNPKQVSADNACGKKVAVQSGTVQDEEDLPARQKKCGAKKIQILHYKGQDQATAAVATGKADAMLADSPVTAFAVKQSKGKLAVLGDVYDSAPYGYVLPKAETEFGTAITKALFALYQDGTYTKVLQNWGVEGGAVSNYEVNPSAS